MVMLCISVYGKDDHFVACKTGAEEWIAFVEAQQQKAGFHMIANDRRRSQTIADRRRSQRDLFPYNRRRSQTIAEPTVAIHFVQRKCHMYSRVVLAGKSKQTT